MNANDTRHGTHAGYKAGCRGQCCKDAAARYERHREWDRLNGRNRTAPTIGFVRRLEALNALGWSSMVIAERLGMDYRNLATIRRRKFIFAGTHRAMVQLYDELSMTVPQDRYANRRRSIAARKGYAPPLAWDDIDDPDERPDTGRKGYRNALAEYEWLTSCGESHEQAIKKLGVTEDAIEQAKRRARRERERKAA